MSSIIKSNQYVPVSIELPKTNILRSNHYIQSKEEVFISSENLLENNESKKLEEQDEYHQQQEEWLMEKQLLLEEAQREAEKILLIAQEQADDLIHRTHQEVEDWWNHRREEDELLKQEAFNEGYRQGFQQGHAQGYEEGWERQQPFIIQAQEILEKAYLEKQGTLREAEPFLVQLSVEVAKKILREELSLHPEKILSIVKEALTRVLDVEKLTIGVNPEQFATIQQQKDELKKFLNGEAELVILPDYSVPEGGCVIRSSFGTIDAKLDTQLDEIKQAFLELLKGKDQDGTV